MSVILKIAFRNLKQHRTKTLIIGTLITIGIAILVIGNSLMDTAAKGIRETYTESYTGDLIVTGLHTSPITLFGVQDMDGLDAVVPTVPDYDIVHQFATEHPDVVAVNPQASAASMIQIDETQSITLLFGIEPDAYQNMFPDNIELLQGRFLQAGEEGILLNAAIADAFETELNRPLEVGDNVVLTGLSSLTGIRVREVPIVGIFNFRKSDPQVELVSLIDIENVRALTGMRLSSISEAELTEVESVLFDDFDEEALFGGGLDSLFGGDLIQDVDTVSGGFEEEELISVLGVQDENVISEEDSKAWHFLLVKLRDGASSTKVMGDFAQFFSDNGIAATTTSWLEGAGPLASVTYAAKNTFNILIFVVAIVAVIIIMNTLVISVTERTTEIGTMRALGAQKRFVRRMIAWETVLTTTTFGIIGIIVGCLVLLGLNAMGLEATNPLLEILYGGKVLRPVPSLQSIVMSLVLVMVIGVIASVYPVSIALKTEPVKAMQG